MIDPAAPFNRQPWSGDFARQVLAALEEYRLLWIEQPVLPSRIDDYREIRKHVKTALAAGENGTTLEDFRPYFAQRVIDIVQPDAVWCGGVTEMRRLIAASEAHGLRTAPHCFSGAVGIAANYHVALTSPSCFIVELPGAGNPLIRPLLEPAFTFRKGLLFPTDKPGLGVDIPDEILNKYPFVPGSGLSHPRSPFPRPVPPDWQAPSSDSLSWQDDSD
jgi:L-alanine-DL-glutamate epimerase-like enolase superfamily enzyme